MATNTQDRELRKEGKENSTSYPSPNSPTQTEALGFGVCAAGCSHQSHQLEAIANIVADVGWGILDSNTIPTNSGPQHTQQPSVRFKSTIEEISSDNAASTSLPLADDVSLGSPGQVTSAEIRELSNRLRACPLQERRMNIFSYEPVSLPASRVRIFLVGLCFRAFRQR
jgi:hypothetical protein